LLLAVAASDAVYSNARVMAKSTARTRCAHTRHHERAEDALPAPQATMLRRCTLTPR